MLSHPFLPCQHLLTFFLIAEHFSRGPYTDNPYGDHDTVQEFGNLVGGEYNSFLKIFIVIFGLP